MAWYMYWFPNCNALGGKKEKNTVECLISSKQTRITGFFSREDDDLLSKVLDDVSDHVTLFLQLVIRHHRHHLVVILGQVEVAVLPLGQKVGHIL